MSNERIGDLGTANYREKLMEAEVLHVGKTIANQRRASVLVQIPIDYYFNRKYLTQDDYNAAIRLFKDFCLSGQTSGTTTNLDQARGGEKKFTEAQLEARDRWRKALDAVNGKIGQLMVLNVCCYGYYLKDMGYTPYRNSQEAMPRFKEALSDLHAFYHLTQKL